MESLEIPGYGPAQKKKLDEVIRQIKESDLPEDLYDFGLTVRDWVLQLRSLALPILPKDVVIRLNAIDVDVEDHPDFNFAFVSKAKTELYALVPAVEDALASINTDLQDRTPPHQSNIETFSKRFSFEPDQDIVSRTDAPPELRSKIVDAAYGAKMVPRKVREAVCRCLCKAPDFTIGVAHKMDREIRDLLANCAWYDVYNVIEALYEDLTSGEQGYFEAQINTVFCREGIGWQLVDGKITFRGEGPFESIVAAASEHLEQAGLTTGGNEFKEVTADLSHRPEPKVPGAIDHAYKAVECVMRSVCGDDDATLGDLLKRHKGTIPPPLDTAIEKLWGYASQYGRHRAEGKQPHADDAILAVHVAAVVVIYLSKKIDR